MIFSKKAIVLTLLSLATFFAAPLAFAQNKNEQFVPLAPITHLTDSNTVGSILSSQSFTTFFNHLYKYLIGVAVILAVIMIVWSGIEIARNKGNVSKAIASKGRINNAIFGLILVLAPALVFGIINPSILNLSVNFSPVPQGQTFSGSGSGTGGTTTGPSSNGCTSVAGPLGALVITCKVESGNASAASTLAQNFVAAHCTNGTTPAVGSPKCTNKKTTIQYGSTGSSANQTCSEQTVQAWCSPKPVNVDYVRALVNTEFTCTGCPPVNIYKLLGAYGTNASYVSACTSSVGWSFSVNNNQYTNVTCPDPKTDSVYAGIVKTYLTTHPGAKLECVQEKTYCVHNL